MEEREKGPRTWKLDPNRQTIPDHFYSRTLESTTRAHAWYIGIFVLAKLCSSFSIFLLANFINTKLSHTVPWVSNSKLRTDGALSVLAPMVQIVTFIQLGSGVLFMLILNICRINTLPKLGIRETFQWDSYWIRLILHSICSTVFLCIRIGGLQLCGPFRTVFIGTYYDATLATIVSVCLLRSKLKWHLQGAALFLFAIVFEFVFDDSHLDHVNEPYHQTTNYTGLSMLLLSAFLLYGFNATSFTLNLAKASGGIVQLHSASTLVSGILLSIALLDDMLTGGDLIFFHMLPTSFIVLFGFVLDFYSEAIVVRKLDPSIAARIGTTASFFSAFIFVLVLSQIGTVSTPGLMSLLAFGLIYIATFLLTTSGNGADRSSVTYMAIRDELQLPIYTSSDQATPLVTQMDLSVQNGKNSHAAVLIA